MFDRWNFNEATVEVYNQVKHKTLDRLYILLLSNPRRTRVREEKCLAPREVYENDKNFKFPSLWSFFWPITECPLLKGKILKFIFPLHQFLPNFFFSMSANKCERGKAKNVCTKYEIEYNWGNNTWKKGETYIHPWFSRKSVQSMKSSSSVAKSHKYHISVPCM